MTFGRITLMLLEGFGTSCQLFLLTLVLSLPLGLIIMFGSTCKFTPLRWVTRTFVWIIRGTPLMVQLMFIFYGLPMIGVRFPDISFIPDFNRFAAGIVAMSINSCAYVAEIIRSGIQAVDTGQMEAARSIGYSQAQAMTYVVLPQAIRNILPALGNEFVVVIKESSIVSVIGIADLMFRTKDVIAVTYRTMASLAIVAIIYFCMTFLGSRLIAWMERRMAHGKG